MRARGRTTEEAAGAPGRGRRPVPAWRVAALALACAVVASCASPLTPYPFRYAVAGRVRVEARLADPVGTPAGTRVIQNADSVRVYLLGQTVLDSVRTGAGRYEFPRVAPGRYLVAVGAGGVLTDTVGVIFVVDDDVAVADTLVLRRAGVLASAPNPFPTTTGLEFTLTANGPVLIRVVDLAGLSVRTLANRTFVAGTHQLFWDGGDDLMQTLPDGRYVAVFLAGADRRAEVLLKEP